MEYTNYNFDRDGDGIDLRGFNQKKAKGSISMLFLSLSVYLIISYVIIYLAQFLTVFVFGAKKAAQLFSNSYYIFALQIFAMYLIAFPVFLILTRRIPRCKDYSSDFNLPCYGKGGYSGRGGSIDGITLGEFVALFFVSTSFMIFGSQISGIITNLLSALLGHTVEDSTAELISDSPIFLVILVAVIIGPIIEELIFRKTFIDVLGVYGARFAIVVSAVSFGIFHGNFSQLLYSSLLGLALGYLYTKSHKVIYPILLHMLINFFGTVPTLLLSDSLERVTNLTESAISDEIPLDYITDIMNMYGLLVLQYGFAIAGIAILVYSTKNKLYSVPSRCKK